jgi:hypothetical protein
MSTVCGKEPVAHAPCSCQHDGLKFAGFAPGMVGYQQLKKLANGACVVLVPKPFHNLSSHRMGSCTSATLHVALAGWHTAALSCHVQGHTAPALGNPATIVRT